MSSLDPEATYEFATGGLSRTAIRGVLWSLMTSLAPSMVASLVFLFTSRTLGPKEFGLVGLAAAIATVAGALAPVGFGQAIVQRKTIERRHLDSVFWLCLGSSVLFYGLLVVVALPLAGYFQQPELGLLLPVLGLRIIFDLIGTVPRAVLERNMSFDKMAVRATVASALGGAAGVLAAALYNSIHPMMGSGSMTKAFSASVLGGMEYVTGAIVGGLLLGVVEA